MHHLENPQYYKKPIDSAWSILNLVLYEKKKKLLYYLWKRLIDLKEIKFKDRDEIVEIIRSWYRIVPFEIAKLRDQRLR